MKFLTLMLYALVACALQAKSKLKRKTGFEDNFERQLMNFDMNQMFSMDDVDDTCKLSSIDTRCTITRFST